MKNILLLLVCTITLSCAQNRKKPFSENTLNSKLTTINNTQINLKDIINKNKGKIVIVDVWASWCGDCIRGLPDLKSIQKKYSKAEYVFISLDSNQKAWKRGIEKYRIKGQNYFAPGGWKSDFAKNDNIKWIPTYILIAPNGDVVYRSKKTSSSKFLKKLNKLYNNEK